MKNRDLYAPTDRVVKAAETYAKDVQELKKFLEMLSDEERGDTKKDVLLLIKRLQKTAKTLPKLAGAMKNWSQALSAQEKVCK
jgi:hypothetical protein